MNTLTTIEGNTTDDGGRDGWKSALKRRLLNRTDGHAFIRWTTLVGAVPATAAPSGIIPLHQQTRAA